jgi:hypothetical protein
LAAKNPETRILAAKIAAAERWGRVIDRSAATQPARDGRRDRLRRQVDPNGVLDEVERERRVDSLIKAHMMRMSLAAKRARAERRVQTVPLVASAGGDDAP